MSTWELIIIKTKSVPLEALCSVFSHTKNPQWMIHGDFFHDDSTIRGFNEKIRNSDPQKLTLK